MPQKETKTGAFIEHPKGYSYFLPKDLPPVPPIHQSEEMAQMLSRADQAIARLDGSTLTLPSSRIFVSMYTKKEAVLSSQIEGTQTSLVDFLEFEAKEQHPEKGSDAQEVRNYLSALRQGIEMLDELPICLRLLKDIHKILMKDVRGGEKRPGEFRDHQNYIASSSGVSIEKATFVPPDPKHLKDLLKNFEMFIHDDGSMPVLLKIGLLHAHFETIHPFLDGNGRMGRLLITLLLCKQGILKEPILYLSRYFKDNQAEYYSKLQNVRTKGDWESWLKFFLRGVEQVSEDATETVQKIVALQEKHEGEIKDNFGSSFSNGLKLLEFLYKIPFAKVEVVEKVLGVSYSSANNLIKRFEEAGLLHEITGNRRNRGFVYREYLDLFDK